MSGSRMLPPQPHADSDVADGFFAGHRSSLVLMLLLVAFLLPRVAWLVLDPDTAMYFEEDYRWLAAHELVTGPIQPLVDYQADHYQGGSLVMIGISAIAFAATGESVLALKAPALIFSALTLAALFVIGRQFFGARVGILAAAIFIVGPPLLAHSGLVVMGSHGESALFSLVQIALLLGLLDGRWRNPVGWVSFGLVSGLGVWFCYTAGLSVLSCGLAWVALKGMPRQREVLALLAGGLLGLSPWFAYNVHNDFVGVYRLLEVFGAGDPIDAWDKQGAGEKLLLFFSRDWATGLATPFDSNGGMAGIVRIAFFAPWIVAWLVSFWNGTTSVFWSRGRSEQADHEVESGRPRSEFVFAAYAIIFLAAYLTSDFVVQPDKEAHTYRLFLPLSTVSIIPVSVSLDRALRAGRFWRKVAVASVALLLLASAVGSLRVALRETHYDIGHDAARHRQHGQNVRGVLLHRKYENDLARAFEEARRVQDLRDRFNAFQGIGWGLQYRFEGSGALQPALDEVARLVPGEQVAVLSGLRFYGLLSLDQMEERVRSGGATEREEVQLERLRRMRAWLEPRWNRLPLDLRTRDRISYGDR